MKKLSKPKFYCRFGFSLKFCTRNILNITEYMYLPISRDFICEPQSPLLWCRFRVFASLLHTLLVKNYVTGGLGLTLAQNFKANPNL